MSRWSFILIAAIAVVSFFNGPITGQFRLAKITLPKFAETNAPATPGITHPDPVSGTPRPTPSPADFETVKEYLLTSAAQDFHDHQPPFPVKFRKVRIGHIGDTTTSGSYRLCGEFLPAVGEGGGKAKWTGFATVKTSGYEQYLGPTNYCKDKKITWDTKSDLASVLKYKLDSLKK